MKIILVKEIKRRISFQFALSKNNVIIMKGNIMINVTIPIKPIISHINLANMLTIKFMSNTLFFFIKFP